MFDPFLCREVSAVVFVRCQCGYERSGCIFLEAYPTENVPMTPEGRLHTSTRGK